MTVNANWRVTSGFEDEDAEIVNYEDYHLGTANVMHKPPHPGEVLRELCLEPLGLSVAAAAEALGVSRKTLSAVLNGKAGISPEMAIRLSIAFNTSAESWLSQQSRYELWHAEQHRKDLNVKKLVTA